ncbi:MAG: methyl-accepting chemotaxis protein [Thermodesulfobacteriota bacterium]
MAEGDIREQQFRASGGLGWYCRSMQELSTRLTRLLADREEEFLALGRRLMEFSGDSQSLARQAQGLVQLAAGEDVGQGAQELAAELEEMSGVCDFSRGEQSLDELDRVIKVIESLAGGIAGFGRIVRSLQMLGISTRIESARLGDKGLGFTTLADDVEKLAGKIVANSAQVMDKGRTLTGMIDDARVRTQVLVEAQKGCSSRIVTDLKANLDGLAGLTVASRQLSASLAERSGVIAAGISEVVASLQFHDIVRQQVEHVEEALQDMMDMVRQRGGGKGRECAREENPGDQEGEDAGGLDSDTRDLVGWLADAARLQESQLENAGERFGKALQGLRRNLGEIVESIASMRRDAERLAQDGSGGEGCVLDRMEQGSLSVIAAMRQFAEQAESIGGVMASVAGTVAEMVSFVEDIEEVGSEIELIALNAAIKAARTGDEGRALGVLAQAIQKLSVEARDKTGDVSKSLTEISRSSQDLERNAASYLDTSRLGDLAARQESLMLRLRDVNTRFMRSLDGIRRESGRLSDTLRDTAAHADLDREICAELASARADMGGIAVAARRVVPLSDDRHRSKRLKDLLSRYTMEVERLVHEAAFGQGGGEVRDEAEGEVELFDDDNVELF